MSHDPHFPIFNAWNKQSIIGLAVLGVWAFVSVAAIFAMYHLWWTRERKIYLGKSPDIQRSIVFNNAGLPQVLPDIQRILSEWPTDMRYTIKGSHTGRSYITYLLSPRIPSDNGTASIHINGSSLKTVDGMGMVKKKPTTNGSVGPTARSLSVSLLLICGTAFLFHRYFVKELKRFPEAVALSLLGLTGLLILSRVLTGSSTPGMWVMALSSVAGLVLITTGFYRWIRQANSKPPKDSTSNWNRFKIGATGLCIFIVTMGTLWSLLMAMSVVPDDWDAWATWGPKAKYLLLGEGPLIDVTHLGMADYPLLWPSIWGFASWSAGGWEEHWSKAWGAVLMALTAWEVGLSVKRQIGISIAGWLGAAVLISVPCAPLVASWAYAESALWFMLACSFESLLRWRDERSFVDLLMAGIFAAAACHAKNEGLFFCLLALFWIFLNDPVGCLKNISGFATPVLLIYGPWFWWIKIKLGLVSATTRNLHFDAEHIGWAFSRVPDGIRSALSIWMDVRQWNIVLFLISGAAVYALIRGGRHVRIDLMIPAGMLAGAFILNIFYDGSVHWMFGANWNRLTLQVIPLLLMTLFPYFYFLNRKTASS